MKSSLKIVFFLNILSKVASYVEDFISIRIHEYNTSYISEGEIGMGGGYGGRR